MNFENLNLTTQQYVLSMNYSTYIMLTVTVLKLNLINQVKKMSEFNEYSVESSRLSGYASASVDKLVKSYVLAVSHEEMNSKRRNTMEDCHRILPSIDAALSNIAYFGIYDGHGGRQLVDFLEDALESNLAKELKLDDGASVLERMTR